MKGINRNLLKKQDETKLRLNFNLKQVRDEKRLTQIMLVTTINQKRIRIYTKLRIEPEYWDHRNHRCYLFDHLNLREKRRLKHINKQIEDIVFSLIEADERLAMRGEYLSAPTIREVVKENQYHGQLIKDPITCLKGLIDDYEKSVNRKGHRGIESTKTTYLTALNRLIEFNKQRNTPITSFDDFNKKFFIDFTNYLYGYAFGKSTKKAHYTQNTVINTLKVLKNLLHRAYDNEMTTNNYFLKVQTTLPSDSSEQIYLREKEIHKFAAVFTENDLEREVRDMFVIACYTALRISDIQQLNHAIIKEGVLSLYQTKTKELVNIPIFKEVAPIIAHYQQIGFPVINSVKANKIVKVLAARCNIDVIICYKESRGGETHIRNTPKYNMVSFHTARRSCVTNLYKRGYPINYVMTLSGHRSIQAFQRYLKASSKELMSDFVHLLKKDKAI